MRHGREQLQAASGTRTSRGAGSRGVGSVRGAEAVKGVLLIADVSMNALMLTHEPGDLLVSAGNRSRLRNSGKNK